MNCSLWDKPCREAPYKLCIAVWDWYINGVCFKDNIRATPDESVLTVINYATKELDPTLLTRFDIPNNPLRNYSLYLIK